MSKQDRYTHIPFNDMTLYLFSEDGVNWTEPRKLAQVEKDTLWPYADRKGDIWKYRKTMQEVNAELDIAVNEIR